MALGTKSIRGLVPNALLKEGPFAVGYQVLAPKCTEIVSPYVKSHLSATAIGGAAAGVATALFTQPGAVLRNRIQTDLLEGVKATTWQTAKSIYRSEGPTGFFICLF